MIWEDVELVSITSGSRSLIDHTDFSPTSPTHTEMSGKKKMTKEQVLRMQEKQTKGMVLRRLFRTFSV